MLSAIALVARLDRNIERQQLVERAFLNLKHCLALRILVCLRDPYQVNVLIGGYDENEGPSLYFMDYMASMHPMPFAAHGYGSFFTLSVMDRHFKKDMSVEQALGVMQKCAHELRTRFLINCPKFIVKVVDKDGIRVVDLEK